MAALVSGEDGIKQLGEQVAAVAPGEFAADEMVVQLVELGAASASQTARRRAR